MGKKDRENEGLVVTVRRRQRAGEEVPLIGTCEEEKKTVLGLPVWAFVLIVVGVVLVAGAIAVVCLPSAYSCAAEDLFNESYYLSRVPAPNMSDAAPTLICSNRNVSVTAYGLNFLFPKNNAPTVKVWRDGKLIATASNVRGTVCEKLKGVRFRNIQTCTEMAFDVTVPTDLKLDMYSVDITADNPTGPWFPFIRSEILDFVCSTGIETAFAAVPPPVADGVDHPYLCTAGSNTLVVTGNHFMRSLEDGGNSYEVPTIDVCGKTLGTTPMIENCHSIDYDDGYLDVQFCNIMIVDVDEISTPNAETCYVTVNNPAPASCSSADEESLNMPVVHPPDAQKFSSPSYCTATGEVIVGMDGSGFMRRDNDPSILYIGGEEVPFENWAFSGCKSYSVAGVSIDLCSHFETQPTYAISGQTDPELVDVSVSSPYYDCTGEFTGAFVALPPPVIDSFSPTSICASSLPTEITVKGHFVHPKGETLDVTIGESRTAVTKIKSSGCSEKTLNGNTYVVCNTARFTVPANEDIPIGQLPIYISNGCTTVSAGLLSSIPVPIIEHSSQNSVCAAALTEFVLTGKNFIVEYDVPPSVVVGGYSPVDVSGADCDNSLGDNFLVCSTLTFSVPANTLAENEDATVIVTNSEEAPCASSSIEIYAVGPPTLTAFTEDVCSAQDTIIYVAGFNFTLPSLEVKLVSVDNEEVQIFGNLTTKMETYAYVQFDAGSIPEGDYYLVVCNANVKECQDRNDDRVVKSNPASGYVWSVRPNFLLKGIGRPDLDLFTSNFYGKPDTVYFTNDEKDINITVNGKSFADNTGANTTYRFAFYEEDIEFLEPGTVLSVTARAQSLCSFSEDDLLTVVDYKTLEPSFTISSVTPPHVSKKEDTTLEIVASTAVFDASIMPVVYVMDVSNGAVNKAYMLENVRVLSDTTITADAPYSVIYLLTCTEMKLAVMFIDKSKTMQYALFDTAIPVISVLKPEVTSVVPENVLLNTETTLTVTGTNFATDVKYTVSLECTIDGALTGSLVSVSSATQMTVKIPGVSSDGQVCDMFIVDPTNGFEMEHNALSVYMAQHTPRTTRFTKGPKGCGLASVSATVDGRSFVYAIGGDSEAACTGATTSVRFAEINDLGVLSETWTDSYALPSELSFTTAERIGNYIYLFGGVDASGTASNSVLRAEILQPSEAPSAKVNLYHTQGDSSLKQGLYYYAVSAVFAADDEYNPAGETLPSHIMAVEIPDMSSHALVEVVWDTVPGATSYRVYRTADANADPTKLFFVGESTNLFMTDNGDSLDTSISPLALGSLGQWAKISKTLKFARSAPTSVLLPSSKPATATNYVFVLGGSSGDVFTGEMVNSYETAGILITEPTVAHGRQTHTVSDFTKSVYTFTADRFMKATAISAANSVSYAGTNTASIILSSGESTTAYMTDYMTGNTTLGTNQFVSTEVSPAAHGAWPTISGGALIALGGSDDSGSPTYKGQAMLIDETVPPSSTAAPVKTFSSTTDLPRAVQHAGFARHHGVVYIVGGRSSTSALSDQVVTMPI